jgi:uncharacterized protein (DUF2062 family)
MPSFGPLEILLILMVCGVPTALIVGVIAFVVWVIRWNRGQRVIIAPKDDEDS